jgi:hypothetical protein
MRVGTGIETKVLLDSMTRRLTFGSEPILRRFGAPWLRTFST